MLGWYLIWGAHYKLNLHNMTFLDTYRSYYEKQNKEHLPCKEPEAKGKLIPAVHFTLPPYCRDADGQRQATNASQGSLFYFVFASREHFVIDIYGLWVYGYIFFRSKQSPWDLEKSSARVIIINLDSARLKMSQGSCQGHDRVWEGDILHQSCWGAIRESSCIINWTWFMACSVLKPCCERPLDATFSHVFYMMTRRIVSTTMQYPKSVRLLSTRFLSKSLLSLKQATAVVKTLKRIMTGTLHDIVDFMIWFECIKQHT